MYASIYKWMLHAIKLKIKLLYAVPSFMCVKEYSDGP